MISSILKFSWAGAVFIFAILASRYWRLRSIPGPFLASLTDLWQAYYQNVYDYTEILLQWHERYGQIVRIGPNRVSVSSAGSVSTIYSMHGEFKKAESYHTMRALVNGKIQGSMIDMDDERTVTLLKRAVGAIFAAKNVLDYEHDLEETAAALITRISTNRTVDLFSILQQFQVDFLMKIAFSESPRYLKDGVDPSSLTSRLRFMHWRRWQSISTLEYFIFKPPFLRKFLKTQTPEWAQLASQKLRDRQMADRKEGPEKQTDLLDKYLDAAEKHKRNIDSALIQRMVSSTISAGFDTTAFTMMTMFYFLLRNPDALITLRKEIEDARVQGHISDPPRAKEADRLEYLAATMKEAMRCYPFLALVLERVVPEGGATIAGTWLPGGTVVGCHPSIVHLDSECFGDEPEKFRPERWLVDGKKRIAMERASLGFGSGNRICLGRHLAELEIKKIVPSLLMRFQIILRDVDAKLEPELNVSAFPKPIFVTFEPKPQNL